MKKLFSGMVLTILFVVAQGRTAFATAALELVSGTDILYVADGGSLECSAGGVSVACSSFGATSTNTQAGHLTISALDFNGWNVSDSIGGSNSPFCPPGGSNGPGCVDTSNINAESTGAGTLDAYFADSGFAPGASETALVIANTSDFQTGLLETQTAYANSGIVNPLGPLNSSPLPAGGQCGVALTSGPPGVSATPTTCATPAQPLSLELETVFQTDSSGGGFDVGGNISAVPEPAAVTLLGSILALCASGLRRKWKLS